MSISRARKRQGVLKFPRKWILHIVFMFAVIIFTVFYVNKLKQAEYFPIKSVKIFGVRHVDHQQVQNLVTPFVSQGFFAVDVDAIKQKLRQLPWVAETGVRRIWPDQVLITVMEKNPIARWNEATLLSSAGELFSPEQTNLSELPEFSGPEGQQVIMAQYYSRINNLLTPLHFKISRLELTPSLSWKITLNNGLKLNIGHKDILTRINHFVKVYPKIVGKRAADVEYVDLRYSNGMAVQWKSVV